MIIRSIRKSRAFQISVRIPTLFNRISRDICENKIEAYLLPRDLKSLCIASTSTNVCFDNAMVLRQDAHKILDEAMNGTLESVKRAIKVARVEYGDDVWKLLVIPTYGKEVHCGRHWENESVIRFAARSGNFYQYIYRLTPMPQDQNAVLEHGKLYVDTEHFEQCNETVLNYKVIGPGGEIVINSISERELDFTLPVPLTMPVLRAHLSSIIAIIYDRNEISNFSLENPRFPSRLFYPNIVDTYLLNELFKYIPDEHRHIAIKQLEDLYQSDEALFNCKDLIAAYAEYVNLFDFLSPALRAEMWTKGVGGKQKLLTMHALGLLCAVDHMEVRDINELPAPTNSPVLYVNGVGVDLRSITSQLGDAFAIHHNWNTYGYGDNSATRYYRYSYHNRSGKLDLQYHYRYLYGIGACEAGKMIAVHYRDFFYQYSAEKKMQLNMFIILQQLQDKKYLNEKNNIIRMV